MIVVENIVALVFLFYSITTLPVSIDNNDGEPNDESGLAVSATGINSLINFEEVDGPGLTSRGGIKNELKRWPNATIPYRLIGYNAAEMAVILKAMRTLEFWTCIKFIPVDESNPPEDYVDIVNIEDLGCQSNRGRFGGVQEVNLESPGCLHNIGIPLHELLHAIGLIDHQNRPDRDDYVLINEHNIKPERMKGLWKSEEWSVGNYGITYDYHSVMHYHDKGASKNGFRTIVPKIPGMHIGQRDGMTVRDAMLVMKMYNCSYNQFNVSNTDPYSKILPNVAYEKGEESEHSKERLYKIYFMNSTE